MTQLNTQNNFVHLNVHSEYSIVDGICNIKKMVKLAKEQGMPALAITDFCNFYGLIKFYQACFAEGIKPIIGTEVIVQFSPKQKLRLLLYATNDIGYKNLKVLISESYIQGQAHGVPHIHLDWLKARASGILCIVPMINGSYASYIETLQDVFSQRLFLEITRTQPIINIEVEHTIVELASKYNIPIVATNCVRFLHQEDFAAHEARVCIQQGVTLIERRDSKDYTNQQYFKSQQEMADLFKDMPYALENTIKISQMCNVKLNLNKAFLPNYTTPNGETIEKHLRDLSIQGLQKKIIANGIEDTDKYYSRLDLELKVITSMGFAGYFLIVADFISWAKKNGIPVGPGRGSGAGSIVAYVLGITDLDPIPYDLLFERFLNPERVSMPDFDIDFCMERRDEVIEYVSNKYGKNSVSQIITFGTMAARAVVRDVGRALGVSYGFVDKIAKTIPQEIGITIEKALAQKDALYELYNSEDEVRNLIDLAKKLEGVARNVGKHAGGVVIAPSDLNDFTPVFCEDNHSGLVSQFDKNDVETAGLVKFDFLGLRTLTIIDWAIQIINNNEEVYQDKFQGWNLGKMNDPKTYELLRRGDTTGVFQLESRGMQELIKRLKPDCFEDIVALVALFRPGPLQSGMVDDFIDRKHGKSRVEYLHPMLSDVLKPTYGIILYQEQVMQIAQILAGYTLGEADLLRRAMGKKKPEEMAKQRSIFLSGAEKNNIPSEVASHIFDLMEKFAGYGFNKSHSAAYAVITYQTAWLKTHYPVAFMTAVLTSELQHTDKIVHFLQEVRRMKIKVLPPCINNSFCTFTLEVDEQQQTCIRYGLGAVKGIGEGIVELIVEERKKHGKFKSFEDFFQRVDSKKLSTRILESFVKSGSFDVFSDSRYVLLHSLPNGIKLSEQIHTNKGFGLNDLFSGIASSLSSSSVLLKSQKQLSNLERLSMEKESLGFYFSGHPAFEIEKELASLKPVNICHIEKAFNAGHKSMVIIGSVMAVKVMLTKKGDRMALVAIENGTQKIETVVFGDSFQQLKSCLVKDKLLIIFGDVQKDEYRGGIKLIINNAVEYKNKYELIRTVQIQLNSSTNPELIKATCNSIKEYVDDDGSVLEFVVATDNGHIVLTASNDWLIKVSENLLNMLNNTDGIKSINLLYN